MECDSIMHKLHMCALGAVAQVDVMRSLAENPTVVCEICGALARDPQNLCSPRELGKEEGSVPHPR